MSKGSKLRKRTIIIAMLRAMTIGLIIPLFVISLLLIALFLFKTLNVFIRAALMMLFGLAGLGIGTVIFLKILGRMRLIPQSKKERVTETH